MAINNKNKEIEMKRDNENEELSSYMQLATIIYSMGNRDEEINKRTKSGNRMNK